MFNLPLDFLDNLQYAPVKTANMDVSGITKIDTPTAMVVFDKGDLNSAAYYLTKSLRTPFAANSIISVFVQESVRDSFIAKFKDNLPKYPAEIASHPGFKRALETAAQLKLETFIAPGVGTATATASATIVCDLTHEHFGPTATGIVTLHTFRTAKEAIALVGKESVHFTNITIWNENHACAYELVGALKNNNYFINCWETPLSPVREHAAKNGVFVTLDKSYHYETFPHNGVQKSVVFSIGTIFAN